MRLKDTGLRWLVVVLLAMATACTITPEGKRAKHTERGDRYFAEKKYQEAIIEYKNVLQAVPKDLHATKRLAESYFAVGNFNEAFPFLVKARDYDPEDLDVRLKLATILGLARKPDEVRKEVDFVLEKDPARLEALQLLAALAANPEEAAEVLARLDAVKDAHDQVVVYHLTRGSLYLKSRNVAKAEEAFRTALKRDPDSIEAHLALGDLLAVTRDLAGAEAEYKAAAALAPVDSPVQVKLTDFYLGVQKSEEARSSPRRPRIS